MQFQTNLTIATCTALSNISSNYAPSSQGLLHVMFFELIIIIIMIFIIIVLLSIIQEWWVKRGVKEVAPQLSQYTTGGGGGNDPWTRFLNKVKKLFGRR